MADVQINGHRPWDIRVRDARSYKSLVNGGSLALGESSVDGWWECQALDLFFDRILRLRLDRQARHSPLSFWLDVKSVIKLSTGWFQAFAIGHRHYDIGNDLFSLMLDRWMNYSCAYWRKARDLDQAQEDKMALICLMDYKNLESRFDRIVSVGMFEHVGVGAYSLFMKTVVRSLESGGLFLLHTIGGNHTRRSSDPWISRYIFPNSMIPSTKQISSAAEPYLMIEDWHSFGPDYDPTLMAWYRNFSKNWDKIKSRYGRRFFRMWTYYLLACAGSFRARRNQLWQVVFSKNGFFPGYDSVR